MAHRQVRGGRCLRVAQRKAQEPIATSMSPSESDTEHTLVVQAPRGLHAGLLLTYPGTTAVRLYILIVIPGTARESTAFKLYQ